ncbi:hypothetical protein XI07_04945 [Bradyrhizobium sp. CCBAU 11445]|nr:hypothetical protein [Bradyrhizobium sp. CCBAU 11445]
MPNLRTFFINTDAVQSGYPSDVDERIRLENIAFGEIEQRRPAGDQHGAATAGKGAGLFDSRRARVG